MVVTCPPPHWFLGQLAHWRTPGPCPVAGHRISAWQSNLHSARWSTLCLPLPTRMGGDSVQRGNRTQGSMPRSGALLGPDPHRCSQPGLGLFFPPSSDGLGLTEGPHWDGGRTLLLPMFPPSPEAEARLGARMFSSHTPKSVSNSPAPAGTLYRSRVPLQRTGISVSSQPPPDVPPGSSPAPRAPGELGPPDADLGCLQSGQRVSQARPGGRRCPRTSSLWGPFGGKGSPEHSREHPVFPKWVLRYRGVQR